MTVILSVEVLWHALEAEIVNVVRKRALSFMSELRSTRTTIIVRPLSRLADNFTAGLA